MKRGFFSLIFAVLIAFAWMGFPVRAFADPDNGPRKKSPHPTSAVEETSAESPSDTPVTTVVPKQGPERSLESAIFDSLKDVDVSVGGGYLNLGSRGQGFEAVVEASAGEAGGRRDGLAVRVSYGRTLDDESDGHPLELEAAFSVPTGPVSVGLGANVVNTGRHNFSVVRSGLRLGDSDGNEIILAATAGLAGVNDCASGVTAGSELLGSMRPMDLISLSAAIRGKWIVAMSGSKNHEEFTETFSANGVGSLFELEGSLRFHLKPDSYIYVSGAYESSTMPVRSHRTPFRSSTGEVRPESSDIDLGTAGQRLSVGAVWQFR